VVLLLLFLFFEEEFESTLLELLKSCLILVPLPSVVWLTTTTACPDEWRYQILSNLGSKIGYVTDYFRYDIVLLLLLLTAFSLSQGNSLNQVIPLAPF